MMRGEKFQVPRGWADGAVAAKKRARAWVLRRPSSTQSMSMVPDAPVDSREALFPQLERRSNDVHQEPILGDPSRYSDIRWPCGRRRSRPDAPYAHARQPPDRGHAADASN